MAQEGIAASTSADSFITRWADSGSAERANYQLFLTELCDFLGVERPAPTTSDDDRNAYVFEKAVTFPNPDGSASTGRIDLYRRAHFVCETKQGSERKKGDADPAAPKLKTRTGHGVRGTPAWDAAMVAARGQAERYVRAIPDDNPPFVLVMDVGYSIEIYSDFSRLGKIYTPFPDARSHRIYLKDLASDELRERLKLIWTDPLSLDPSRRSAKVTREIAGSLALLAKSLEAQKHEPELVAGFLMRCLFTLFAEDVDLLKDKDGNNDQPFTRLLEDVQSHPDQFVPMVHDVWKAMDAGIFSPALRRKLMKFNGGLFAEQTVLPLNKHQLAILHEAAKSDWKHVEPAIFGTLLERALDPTERHKLGAHYTPRAYVERLVLPTIIEPLREEWDAAKAAAITLASGGKTKDAVAEVRTYLKHLCDTVVLDPACGSGNFLYVTLEHMKRLEGEVRDQLQQFGEGQADFESMGLTVDPHQFKGIEINPRAAHIADLVLWIGYLQWHFRVYGNTPPREPVLRAFHNIENRDAVLAYDSKELVLDDAGKPVSRWDGKTTKKHPVTGEDVPDESARVPVYRYVNPRKADWITKETRRIDFVVGNPPFIGNKRMVATLSKEYCDALRHAHLDVPESADFVMYWWNYAAVLTRNASIRRFGLITTNSITQAFNRRVLSTHLDDGEPLHLTFAVPDHPWADSSDGAAVRIAMTVGAKGSGTGVLSQVLREVPTNTEEVAVELKDRVGIIHEDLRSGADVASAVPLQSNSLLCGQGMKLVGDFFAPEGISTEPRSPVTGLPVIRNMITPSDVLEGTSGRLVIDFFDMTAEDARRTHAKAYQHIVDHVKPLRDQNRRDSIRELWWRFAWDRPVLREAIRGIAHYFVTLETAKYRTFVPTASDNLWDGSLFAIALSDLWLMGILSSRAHTTWAIRSGGMLGPTPRYNRTQSFEAFPFPVATDAQKSRIRELGEQLEAHRKKQQTAHPGLTITDMYNVLEKLRSGEALTDKDKTIHEHGLVSVLKQIHDDLDAAAFAAYGWPINLTDEQILEKLVALNAERAAEEKRGLIRWLRPEFQNKTATQQELDLPAAAGKRSAKKPKAAKTAKVAKQAWPSAMAEQAKALRAALFTVTSPQSPAQLAKCFRRAKVERVAELLETFAAVGQARKVGEGYLP